MRKEEEDQEASEILFTFSICLKIKFHERTNVYEHIYRHVIKKVWFTAYEKKKSNDYLLCTAEDPVSDGWILNLFTC